LIIFFLILSLKSFGQTDSVSHAKRDTSRQGNALGVPKNDSLQSTKRFPGVAADSLHAGSADSIALSAKNAETWQKAGEERLPQGKEESFYILAGLLAFLGVIKMAYPKYFQNIFRLFFQTSLRQKQTPEQITRGYVPGFLLNLLFFMVGGMIIAIYGIQQNWLKGPLWLLILDCSGILAAIYLVKYAVTFFAGWVFNVQIAAGTYTFIVFLINRVIGIILLPLLILLSFYGSGVQSVIFTIAASIVVFLLIYRYALSLTVIRKNLKVSALHFFIYLCAVEVMPLLVIYKVLFNEIAKSK